MSLSKPLALGQRVKIQDPIPIDRLVPLSIDQICASCELGVTTFVQAMQYFTPDAPREVSEVRVVLVTAYSSSGYTLHYNNSRAPLVVRSKTPASEGRCMLFPCNFVVDDSVELVQECVECWEPGACAILSAFSPPPHLAYSAAAGASSGSDVEDYVVVTAAGEILLARHAPAGVVCSRLWD